MPMTFNRTTPLGLQWIVLVLMLLTWLGAVAATADPAPAPAPAMQAADITRFMATIQRLDPPLRERALALWHSSREHPEIRRALAESATTLDGKLNPSWTNLLIGGGVTGVGAGVLAGALAVKMGAVGMVAGPIGAVVGLGVGALVGLSVHRYHQNKAIRGGVFSRMGRAVGIKGRGFEGDLLRLEGQLATANAPAAPAAAPRRSWNPFHRNAGAAAPGAPAAGRSWNPFRRSTPAAAPTVPSAPAAPAAAPVAPASTPIVPSPTGTGSGGASRTNDGPNMDDLPNR